MTTTAKTVEQLKEELRLAQEAVAEQERIVREKAREEKYAAEKKIREAEEAERAIKMGAALHPVYQALLDARVACVLDGCKIKIEGNVGDIFIEREMYSTSSWRSSPTGRFTIVVDSCYSNDFPKVRYPQLKAGGFNVPKIVKTIQERLEIAAARVAEAKRLAIKKASGAGLAANLKQELGIESNSSLLSATRSVHYPKGNGRSEYHEYTAEPGHVFMTLGTQQYNAEQVRVMHAALVECAKLATKKA